jgi:hypothetical protein
MWAQFPDRWRFARTDSPLPPLSVGRANRSRPPGTRYADGAIRSGDRDLYKAVIALFAIQRNHDAQERSTGCV